MDLYSFHKMFFFNIMMSPVCQRSKSTLSPNWFFDTAIIHHTIIFVLLKAKNYIWSLPFQPHIET